MIVIVLSIFCAYHVAARVFCVGGAPQLAFAFVGIIRSAALVISNGKGFARIVRVMMEEKEEEEEEEGEGGGAGRQTYLLKQFKTRRLQHLRHLSSSHIARC